MNTKRPDYKPDRPPHHPLHHNSSADEESALFLKELVDVAPLPQNSYVDRKPQPKSGDKYLIRQQLASSFSQKPDDNPLTETEVKMLQPYSWLEYKNPGVQQGVYRKLRLGKYPIETKLDLHRKTIRESRKLVWDFINLCLKKSYRTVLITHGKGEQSQPPARVKSYVAHWLSQIPEVLAYHTAQRQHGSYGAVYILLKKSEHQKQQTREKFSR